jgi:hypothetical protein
MKKTLDHIKIALLAVILPILSVNAQTSKPGHPGRERVVTEKYALDTVMRIPEIKEDDLYIRRATKGKRHLFSMIYGDSDNQHPYYWVVVGEDNGMSFVTHFTFFVYTNGRKILYHDNFSDSTIDLNLWRRGYRRK